MPKKDKKKLNKKPSYKDPKLIEVYRSTVDFCNSVLKYSGEQGSSILSTIESIDDKFRQVDLSKLPIYKNNVTVRNEKTLQGATDLMNYKTLVLNFASDRVPGGGVKGGAKAQEEDLFRKTSYCMYLNPIDHKHFYPLKKNQLIKTTGVKVIKNDNYEFLEDDKRFNIDCIALAGIRKPEKHVDKHGIQKYLDKKDYELTQQKIESIFKLGIISGHEALVLGAIGCGVFGNPVHDMKDIFQKTIVKYGKYFKKIRFSILSREDINYDVFKKLK